MSRLNVGQQVALLLLQRVHGGHVRERFGAYFDDGERIWYWAAYAISGLIVAGWVELIYPPDSAARRRKFVPWGLTECAQLGLTETEVTRRVTMTERGLAEYRALCQQAGLAESPRIAQ